MAYFKALNYEVVAAEDVITFKGVMGRSNSQAYFLTFCTFVGLASLGLVLSVLFPDVGGKAYAVTGIFYSMGTISTISILSFVCITLS